LGASFSTSLSDYFVSEKVSGMLGFVACVYEVVFKKLAFLSIKFNTTGCLRINVTKKKYLR
jgi:hypothetical protein